MTKINQRAGQTRPRAAAARRTTGCVLLCCASLLHSTLPTLFYYHNNMCPLLIYVKSIPQLLTYSFVLLRNTSGSDSIIELRIL